MDLNSVIMQYFEWYLKEDCNLWKQLKDDSTHLKEIGITAIWIPPCMKATSTNDTGYGIYDLFDLGEFDQKGSVRTKYGTKKELHEAIEALHDKEIKVYADIVLNHKAAADGTQRFMAVEVDPMDRNKEVTEPYEIEGWTKFDFNGRNNAYSDFKWSWEHFNGIDYNQETQKSAIYLITGENKEWAHDVAEEFGNYDYLMFSNIDYSNQDVYNHTMEWISWFIKETKVDGIRLDAIKHINDWFIKELVLKTKKEFGEDFYSVGEYWSTQMTTIENYLSDVDFQFDVFDVPLHFKFHQASYDAQNFDMSQLFKDTIVENYRFNTVTFVENHDSQPNQSLESHVKRWFKPLAYAAILLIKHGYPCIFYGDYYGTRGDNAIEPMPEVIDKLLQLRKNHAHGRQDDYLDHQHVIGWVRLGDKEHPRGCAVIMTSTDEGEKTMFVGEMHKGEIWIDALGNIDTEVKIDEEGNGEFKVNAGSVSVYVSKS